MNVVLSLQLNYIFIPAVHSDTQMLAEILAAVLQSGIDLSENAQISIRILLYEKQNNF